MLFKSQNATTKALDNFLPGVPDGKDVTIANVDMAILRNERLGAEISLRAFVHLHATFKTKREIAKRYGNKGAIMQQITDGWFTTERLLKAMKKMIRTSGNQLGENAFRKGIQMIAAIFWASRHDGPFGSAFGVSIGQPKVAILGRGLANLSFGASTTDPWGNPNLDTDLADFVAEFATRDLALDDTWVDKFVDKKFPGIGRRRIALGP